MNFGRGSTGNVIAAIASFILPGLGQLAQGRVLSALIHFLFSGALWMIGLGWIMHIWSALDAAWHTPRIDYRRSEYHSFIHRPEIVVEKSSSRVR